MKKGPFRAPARQEGSGLRPDSYRCTPSEIASQFAWSGYPSARYSMPNILGRQVRPFKPYNLSRQFDPPRLNVSPSPRTLVQEGCRVLALPPLSP